MVNGVPVTGACIFCGMGMYVGGVYGRVVNGVPVTGGVIVKKIHPHENLT